MKTARFLSVLLVSQVVASFAHGGTVAHWRFDDGAPGTLAGTLVTDVNSPTLDAAAHPATPPQPVFSADVPSQGRMRSGVVNQASLQFPLNTGVYVAYPSDDPLLQAGTFTIEAFVNTTMTSPTYPAIVEKVRGPGGDTWSLGLDGSFRVFTRFDATGGSNQTSVGGPSLNDGLWHHVALTYDGTTARLYADYQNVATRTISGSLQHQNGLDVAGGAGGHQPFDGKVDEVRFSDALLTPGQFLHPVAIPVAENASRKMTAGDFNGDGIGDVALIDAAGAVRLSMSGASGPFYVPGVTASALTAADLDGDSIAEIAFVDGSTGQLRSYSVTGGTFTSWGSPTGTGVAMLSAGDVDGDGRHELMVNRADATDVHILQPETGTYSGSLGQLARFTSGELIEGNAGAEFVGRGGVLGGNGAAYYYDFDTNAWTGLGGGCDEVVPGNYFDNDAVDEIMVNNASSKGMYLWNQGIGYRDTTGSGEAIGAGSIDAVLNGRDLWYVIGSLSTTRTIYQSLWDWSEGAPVGYTDLRAGADPWSALVGDNSGWADLLLADINGDGLDELIARKLDAAFDGYLFVFAYGDTAFQQVGLVPEPSTFALAAAGLLGIVLSCRRGRRRKA